MYDKREFINALQPRHSTFLSLSVSRSHWLCKFFTSASSLPLVSFSRDFIFSSCFTVADSSEDMVALLLVSSSTFELSFAIVSC